MTLDHTCNKYCDLIGQSEGSILHRKPCNYLESHVTHLESHVTHLENHVNCAFFDAPGKI